MAEQVPKMKLKKGVKPKKKAEEDANEEEEEPQGASAVVEVEDEEVTPKIKKKGKGKKKGKKRAVEREETPQENIPKEDSTVSPPTVKDEESKENPPEPSTSTVAAPTGDKTVKSQVKPSSSLPVAPSTVEGEEAISRQPWDSDSAPAPPSTSNPDAPDDLEGKSIKEPKPASRPASAERPATGPGAEKDGFPTQIQQRQTATHITTSTPKKTSYKFEAREFDNLDPKEYGIELSDEEFKYEPPAEDHTLPDLYRLMDTLEGGDSDLETSQRPPALFTRPEHVPNYQKISELRLAMEEEDIQEYVEGFETDVRDEVLMIGNISLEEIQEEEKRLRDEHIAYQQQEAEIARQRQEGILISEEQAKKRMAKRLKEKRRLLAKREEIAQQKERLLMDRLHKAFRRSENQLTTVLERRKGEVKTMYGDLTVSDGHYGGSKGRRWKVDWNKTPQPIQVKLNCLRGVKDKLPAGRYVLMVSLYNRLGGIVMRWSNLKGQQWGGATLPTHHDGNFYNAELKLEQSVFTVLPAKPSVRPGMVLVFELFLLRGAVVPTDRVVGWGAFPICDGNFDIIEGKYKCPLLRGEMDTLIDKHEKIEELMASDVDHWLSNLYFEVVKLPRYMAGQKEYEVELQFLSGILSHPDRVNTGEEAKDGEEPIPGSHSNMGSTLTKEGAQSEAKLSLHMSSILGKSNTTLADDGLKSEDGKPDKLHVDLRQRRPMTTIGSRNIHKDNKVKVGNESDSDDYDDEEAFMTKKDEDFMPVKGEPGLFYKRHMNNPVDVYAKKLYTMLPKTPILNPKRRQRKLTHLEQLEQHSFSVKPPFSEKGHLPRRSWEKVNYVGRMFLAELGLSQWRSREFWGMVMLFVFIFFLRLYLHYIGQWLFLNAIEIPINKFEFLPYTVNLNYQSTLLHTREEIAMVSLGPFLIILTFTLLVIIDWLMQKIFGMFPDLGSKFIICFGIHAVLDPITIMIIDLSLQRYLNSGGDQPIADCAKLYWHFNRAEGSGLAGIFITLFLYFCLCFMAAAILYMFFLRLHNNGRMLDVYWRLHGDEDMFFVPHDLEISNQELSYITKKAEQWRGEEGERRKTAVYDYIWEEENVEESIWDDVPDLKKNNKREITTHVSIHTLHLDGLRELFRHFLRLPDGAIVEVFGEMSVTGMDKDVTSALKEGAGKVENLMGSQASFHKIRGRQTVMTASGFQNGDAGLGSQILKPPSPSVGAAGVFFKDPGSRPSTAGSGKSRSSTGSKPRSRTSTPEPEEKKTA
ncbi:uncharacterized protein LOC106170172 [Lingula anatina]|uniref:Uncharacterized protein LOC106170172 n=1 Tax=Lingula anatina TaxID=7574 RepID=A0A1S3J536_LINAN|nr:uncharacterized protein LOC106170172 [Lingula anatina]XP_013405398.1 uncharacterized protein LOC106170172 [Lingula anatina]|eukprot:XP_013405388.1 uncharacterized protein LOC106170172 [Lingula anatina]